MHDIITALILIVLAQGTSIALAILARRESKTAKKLAESTHKLVNSDMLAALEDNLSLATELAELRGNEHDLEHFARAQRRLKYHLHVEELA